MNVLICDADAAVRQVLKRLLSRTYGCEISEASTGLETFEMLSRRPADVIILDVHLPIMNGVEVSAALRQSTQFRDTPIMVLTAEREEAVITRLVAIGVSDLVLKPLRSDSFVHRFGALVSKVMASQHSVATNNAPPSLSPGSTVLIVDGDPEYRALFGKTLTGLFVVSTAESGAETISRCLTVQPPKAVFIGQDLGLVGAELLANKLRSALGDRVRIIGVVPKRELEAARHLDYFNDVIPRSFVAATLKAEAQKLLQHASALAQFQHVLPGLRPTLVAAAEQVCGLMLNTEVESGDAPLKLVNERVAYSTVDLEVSGFTLHFKLRYGAEAGRHVAAAFLEGAVDDMADEDADSVAGEMANVIAGRLHNSFVKAGAPSKMGLPVIGTVAPGTDDEPIDSATTICFSVTAVSSPIEFDVRVRVEQPQQVESTTSVESEGTLTALRTSS